MSELDHLACRSCGQILDATPCPDAVPTPRFESIPDRMRIRSLGRYPRSP